MACGGLPIIAEYRSDDLTEIKLIGVRGILYTNGAAGQNWRLIEGEFEKAGLRIASASISRRKTGDFVTPMQERELVEMKTRPKFGDEQEFKSNCREFYKTTPVHDRLHLDHDSGRFYNDEEIEINVEQDWESHKRRVGDLQARWDEIHSFDGMTTEQATDLYFERNAQDETTKEGTQAHDAPTETPTKPGKGASREEWYQYKRACDKIRKGLFTHADLGRELCIAETTAKKYYNEWADAIEDNPTSNEK